MAVFSDEFDNYLGKIAARGLQKLCNAEELDEKGKKLLSKAEELRKRYKEMEEGKLTDKEKNVLNLLTMALIFGLIDYDANG